MEQDLSDRNVGPRRGIRFDPLRYQDGVEDPIEVQLGGGRLSSNYEMRHLRTTEGGFQFLGFRRKSKNENRKSRVKNRIQNSRVESREKNVESWKSRIKRRESKIGNKKES